MDHLEQDAPAPARAYVAAMEAAGYGLSPWGTGYLVTLPEEIADADIALAWRYAEARKADPAINQRIRAVLLAEGRS
jgi:hypothetical protein